MKLVESEWTLVKFDSANRITIPKPIREFFEVGYPNPVWIKVKKAIK